METLETAQVDAGQENLDCWAYVELFGHSQIAGRLSTRKMGTEVMFQVDVPKGQTEFSRSELYSPKAVFSIKPTTEAWCRKWAAYREASNARDVLPYVPTDRQLSGPVVDADQDNRDDFSDDDDQN